MTVDAQSETVAEEQVESEGASLQPLDVRIIGEVETAGKDFTSWNTFLLNGVAPNIDAQRILPLDRHRDRATILIRPGNVVAAPVPAQPAVPASTVAVFNTNPYPVSVTVTGGTVSQIAVNGVNTNLTTGTVVVPSGGFITLTYTVAPTWVWANLNAAAANTAGFVLIGSRAQIFNGQGGQFFNGDSFVMEGVQETWVTSDGIDSLKVVVIADRFAGM